jgi:serine phosphatase RsbU (regulator of sigma subunit)/K+-sensing histidine kinase KdpD
VNLRELAARPSGRSVATRYGIALAAALLGVALSEALQPLTGHDVYPPLIGAVAIAVWYGGVGPASLAIAVCWLLELEAAWGSVEDRARWLTGLAVALAIVWVTSVMRLAEAKAAARAAEATRTGRLTERLRDLAAELAGAATPSEVAHALVDRGAGVLRADAGSVGLVVGNELELVQPGVDGSRPGEPPARVPLHTRSALSEAVRDGVACSATTAAELRDRFPDDAPGTLRGGGVIAAPLRAGGAVVGGVSFRFGSDNRVDDESVALAELAAGLGGQALERARVYDEERSLREGLDRALRVAPQAGGGSPEEVAAGICREARRTFGADVALMLSILDDERFSVDWREPATLLAPPGLSLHIADLPDLRSAAARGEIMWVPDMLESVRGEALELARALGTVSALRIPVAHSGKVDRVLVLQWTTRPSEPSSATLALARRFADQAGLALEQAERRSAEAIAERRADETRKLLDVTSALAVATTTHDVVDMLLGHGALALGAERGIVAVREGETLIVAGAAGSPVDMIGRRIPIAEPLPIADAVRRNEIVVLESSEDIRLRYPLLDQAWAETAQPASIALPLVTRGAAIGGAAFAFDRPRRISEAQRQLLAAIARQASEALERARLHEAEGSSRARAERAASRLAHLHALGIALARAQTEEEVAEAVGREITGVPGGRSAALYVVDEGSAQLRNVGRAGQPSPAADRYAIVPADADLPLAIAVRTGEAIWSSDERALHHDESEWAAAGAGVWGVIPMVVEDRAVGALAVGFEHGAVVDDDARRFVETVARYAGQPLDRVRLLVAERSARVSAETASDRTQRLQAATEALAIAVTTRDVAESALRHALDAVRARAGVLYLRPPGSESLEVATAAGAVPRRAGEPGRPLARAEQTAMTQAAASGEIVELSSAELIGRYPALARPDGTVPAEAAVCVPVAIGDRLVGAFLLVGNERSLETEDRDVLLTLAGQSAQALERARLLDAEHAAATRLRRLHAITAALSGAATVEDVGRATLAAATEAVAAEWGAVLLAHADMLALVASTGAIPSGSNSLAPVEEAVRSATPAWELELAGGGRRCAVLPLAGSGGVVGALVLGFATARPLPPDDRAWLLAVAAQCAQALERSRLYEQERENRARVERLQRLTATLSTAVTPAEVTAAVLSQGRDALGADGAALVGVTDGGDALEVREAVGMDERVAASLAVRLDRRAPATDAVRSKRPVFSERRDELRELYPESAEEVERLGESFAVAPLVVEDLARGALWFVWSTPRTFEPADRLFVETLARQSAQALDRARRHEAERQIAETLQRSMLPDELPHVPGVHITARYLAGTAGMEVGGDWYDVVPLDNGCLGFAVGDVVGKGVRAASTMGQVRNALRAFAVEQLPPATTVSRLNALLDTFADVPFATLVYLVLDPASGVCRYTLAGHPPPLLVSPAGAVQRLEGGRSLPLGVGREVEFDEATTVLEQGSTIVVYTDGLVERPERSLEDGLDLLAQSLEGAAALASEAVADQILMRVLASGDRRDDVALLVVRLDAARVDAFGDGRVVVATEV